MDVGAALREARLHRGLSLEDVAKATKVKVAFLRAIEINQRDELPETIFVRGFVRAFAREVGLDPDGTARQFLDQFAPPPDLLQQGSAPGSEETPSEWAPHETVSVGPQRAVGTEWLIVAIVVAISIAGYGVARWRAWAPDLFTETFFFQTSSADLPIVTPPPEPAPGVPAPANAAPIGTTGSRPPVATAAPSAGVLRLDIRADGPCWVGATVDGARIEYGLMQAGEHRVLDVHTEAVLRVGDPAAFAFSINGAAGRSLGRPGEPVTVHITPANYRDFLRP